jgi:DNA-binding LytR/AlgR family response regulator
MKFSCIIVDDEPLSHNVLKSHLEQMHQIQLIGSFHNARDAGKYLESHSADIMLLDIQMPEINGLDFLRSLEVKPVTIITTAFRDHALEGFELGVIDYLLKPIELERFKTSMKRAVDFLQLIKYGDTIDLNKTNNTHDILIKSGTRKILLDYRKIIFAQGLKDYTILHTDEKKYVVKGSIKAFEEYLPSDTFIRVHKSFIVARPLIKVVHKNKIELNAIAIPIGRNFKDAVDALLKNATGNPA